MTRNGFTNRSEKVELLLYLYTFSELNKTLNSTGLLHVLR